MLKHVVSGGGGIKLHVEETGNPGGKSILFIHGLSQSRLAWKKQVSSELAHDFRLVAMDIRGHGLSDRTPGAYGDSALWAEDVHAVIKTLELDRPVLCGWSYGGLLMTDYVDRFGEDDIAGTHWVSALSRLGEPLVGAGMVTRAALAAFVGSFSEQVGEMVPGLQEVVRLYFHRPPSPEDACFFLGCGVLVPPSVRAALFARDLDNDRVVRQMERPMLLSYGAQDLIVPTMASHIAALAVKARLSLHPEAGHSPFWECPDRFNRELAEFRASC